MPYEDVRIEYEKWPEHKPTMPFGQVPVLEVDGKRIANSMVIARYLAEEFGLAGSSSFENSQLAGIACAINDLFEGLVKAHFEKDEEKKAELQKTLMEKTLPFTLAKLEALGSTNDSGYLWGNRLTWVDLAFFNFCGFIIPATPTILDNYPSLKKLNEMVETLPNIAKWLKERPVTDY